ncbi:hypothetical protein [Shimia sp.]|uniref:hypothetical protein n=1 Tax=Shimia sp. TaxID=1954381 RepID=UPI003BAB60F2
MATIRCPFSGIDLNDIAVKRASLSFEAALTVHILRLQGRKIHTISAMLGTNQARVVDVLQLKVHPEAANLAVELAAA